MAFWRKAADPELSPKTEQYIDILFPEEREKVKVLLLNHCGNNLPFLKKADPGQLERYRFAALECSNGNFAKLEDAVALAKQDWRDLLLAAGFGDPENHLHWEPQAPRERK